MTDFSQSAKTEDPNSLEPFKKIIDDFTADIVTTFPEYSGIVSRWWGNNSRLGNVNDDISFVFQHCLKVFPERFFDILYNNEDIFAINSTVNTEFLPGIVFKQLWSLDISDNNKQTIWKYLQLILFSVIGSVNHSHELGDSAKLFEAINEDELKQKLEETLEGMQTFFDASFNGCEPGTPSVPNAQELQDHIQTMLGGNIGKLALELAEEAAKDLNMDVENNGDAKTIFKKLFQNPGKMMNMLNKIGTKLDEKIKSGEIKESELMEEGLELFHKMKHMPGMNDMQKMFSQCIPGGKLNMGAMESQLNQNLKTTKMKERMRAKVDKSRAEKESAKDATPSINHSSNGLTDEELIQLFSSNSSNELMQLIRSDNQTKTHSDMQFSKFSTGEKVEKSMRGNKKKKK
jgi:hypothetical protein